MVYTPELAKYAAMGSGCFYRDTELNTSIDIGWNKPVNGEILESFAFADVLKKPIQAKAVIPYSFALKYIMPVVALLNDNMHEHVYQMIRWIDFTGVYVSKNPQRQKQLFGDLPTVEESVERYCRDRGLI